MLINKERVLKTFIDYASISSPTLSERQCANKIIQDLNEFGYNVYEDKAGEELNSNANNIYFFVPGEQGTETFAFSSHMDTVTPCANIKVIVEDGYVKTDGNTVLGADDKAGIVAIIEALRIIKEKNLPHRALEIIFTIHEEGGLKGSKLIEYNKLKAKKCIVLDSSGDIGRIVINAPGQNRLSAKITGRMAHAGGDPENGISAIMVAAEAISHMKLLRIDKETTANIGTLTAISPTNVVCAEANMQAEIRSLDKNKLQNQTEHMIEELKKACNKYGAKLEYDYFTSYYSYKHDKNDDLAVLIENKCKEMGLQTIKEPTGGGSDANSFNANGIKALTIGVGMEKEHTCQEKIKIENLENLAELMVKLMTL